MLIATKNYLLIFVLTLPIYLIGQEQCTVLLPAIADQYVGECKKGLANGKGVAMGLDKYEGFFKKGYPDGEGVYTWSTGEAYDGEWKKGKRHGVGKYMFVENNELTVKEGIWDNDIYIGEKPIAPKVLDKTGIERFSFQRQGEGNQITIKIFLNSNDDISMSDFKAISSSGIEFWNGNNVGFENISFPFTCKLTYYSWNKTYTSRNFKRFEFQIESPGRYVLTIHNN